MRYIDRFLNWIAETFNTRNYVWLPVDNHIKTALFKMQDKEYYINFDELKTGVINLYFFLWENDKPIFDVIRANTGNEFKILSNVKNCVEEFINKNPNLELLLFSSYEQERDSLYMLFLQHIARPGFNYSFMDKKFNKDKNKFKKTNKRYYYIYKKDLPELILNTYLDEILTNDDKHKK